MLTRIYGTAFHSKEDLEAHLHRLEEARARDHRKLGRELDLFLFSELSPGSPFWQPNGMVIWNELTALWREENGARGYREVKTPILYDVDLFKASGHWDVYRENMYFTDVEERPMGMKPMNCPAHIQLYNDERRSYRDLPVRYSEAGLVHRHEPSGTLHGLLRVRHITQDDAHIFCTEEQIEEEVIRCLEFGFAIYDTFGFEPRLELSTRPEKRIGAEEMWDRAEAALQRALDQRGLEYDLNEGDGAFYGPKIDLHMTDTIGRSWQLGTVQLDYVMPERFELGYTGADNADHRPVMIHRALMGSFERFIGILIEHYAGEFPLWLAPVQARVLPLADRHADYAREVAEALSAAGLRAELDDRTESVGRKIREAELRKVPYMLVVGDREAEQRAVALRRHREGDLGTVALDEAVTRLAGEAVTAVMRAARRHSLLLAVLARRARAARCGVGRHRLGRDRGQLRGRHGVLEVRRRHPGAGHRPRRRRRAERADGHPRRRRVGADRHRGAAHRGGAVPRRRRVDRALPVHRRRSGGPGARGDPRRR